MTNYSNNCVRYLLLIFATFFVYGNAGAQSTDRTKAFGYAFTAEELSQYPQKTDVPTVYLEIYKTTVIDGKAQKMVEGETPELEDLSTIFGTKNDWYYNAQIIIRDDNGTIKERKEPTTIRGRGNATWNIGNAYKKALRLKFPNKTDLLTTKENGVEVNNFATEKNWTLLANYYDATLIRNAMTYKLGKRLGLAFCPAYKFIDLVVNGTYMGTYQISDQVQVADKRVPVSKNGYFVESHANKTGFAEDPYFTFKYHDNAEKSICINVKNPDPDVETPSGETTDPLYAELKAMLKKISVLAYNGPYDQAINWRSFVNLESAINAFIGLELTGNYDGAVGNNYAYVEDVNSQLFFGPLWDTDLAWGGLCNSVDMSNRHFWESESTAFGNLCKQVFENDPYFISALHSRWKELYDNGLETYLLGCVDELTNEVYQSGTKNYDSVANGGAGWAYEWTMGGTWADGNTYKWDKEADNFPAKKMKAFITSHISWLNTTIENIYAAKCPSPLPEIPEGSTSLSNNIGKHSWGGNTYVFTTTEEALKIGYELKVTLGSGATGFDILKGQYEKLMDHKAFTQSGNTYSLKLKSEDVAAIKALSYQLPFVVYGGSITTIEIIIPPCTEHDYTQGFYEKQENGTYLRTCANCSHVEDNGETYYQFSVYTDEASITTPAIVYATSWTPSAGNNIATVEINPGLEGNITGHNIVNIKKNTAGNKVCKDFHLVDDAPYYSADKFFAEKATYTRTVVTAGAWGTIVLPFGYTGAQNNDATFYRINSLSSENNTTTLMLDEATSVAENEPVLFKMAEGKTSFTINATNVEVKKSTAKKEGTYVGEWRLMGSVVPLTIDVTAEPYSSKNLYYISKNKFWHAKTTVTVKPFRAYIEGAAIPTTSNAIQLRIINGDITRIENVENTIFQENASSYYTLDGRRLHGKPTEKGIYIFNGRKEVIR